MDQHQLSMNANQVVAFLQKFPDDFTKDDIVRFIADKGIRMVNFMYPGGDGKLKTLNFVINDASYLDTILTCGERVDGSSLFSFVEAGSSDLYVIPRFSLLVLRQGWCLVGKCAGTDTCKGLPGVHQNYRNGISGDGRTRVLCHFR